MAKVTAIDLDRCRDMAKIRALILEACHTGGMVIFTWDGKIQGFCIGLDTTTETLIRKVIDLWTTHPGAIGDLLG